MPMIRLFQEDWVRTLGPAPSAGDINRHRGSPLRFVPSTKAWEVGDDVGALRFVGALREHADAARSTVSLLPNLDPVSLEVRGYATALERIAHQVESAILGAQEAA